MKNKMKIIIPVISVFILLAVLFISIPGIFCDDDGTREYVALTSLPDNIKPNGKLSGDHVTSNYENVYYDKETESIDADMIDTETSAPELDSDMDYKPVIYLYPEKETKVNVKLSDDERLTFTYPVYNDGWTVTASPDGTLTDRDGMLYNCLYREGLICAQYDMSQGFCVKGEDTAEFFDEALKKLGLNRREANEFIVYWLPLMERNPYNIISFQSEEYIKNTKLEITPAPDTLIRVFMVWQKSDFYVELPSQELTAPERNGFTVIEWGGTNLMANNID